MVPIDNVVRTHVFQMNPLFLEELQSLVHVLQTVDSHSSFGRFGLEDEITREATIVGVCVA